MKKHCRNATHDISPGSPAMALIKIKSATDGNSPTPVLYATRDGQSRRIARHVVERLAALGNSAIAYDLAAESPAPADVADAPAVVVVAAVRYGRHLPEAGRFLAQYRRLAAPPPLALASVNLTARKPDKNTVETNPYLRKLIASSGARPAVAIALAGRLDYPRYRWLDRQIIRAIMWLTGGPTDPRTCVEYTSWAAVDVFAARIAELHSGMNPHGQNRTK
jgi:menaquinone-dependent protoporphyrinogen oxidase